MPKYYVSLELIRQMASSSWDTWLLVPESWHKSFTLHSHPPSKVCPSNSLVPSHVDCSLWPENEVIPSHQWWESLPVSGFTDVLPWFLLRKRRRGGSQEGIVRTPHILQPAAGWGLQPGHICQCRRKEWRNLVQCYGQVNRFNKTCTQPGQMTINGNLEPAHP